jgi:hypothetical protein
MLIPSIGPIALVRDIRPGAKPVQVAASGLALAETKERVNQILIAGMSDWTGLARFRPQATRSVR